MPTPGANESREDFIGRCPGIVMNDGTADDHVQAVAICSQMWRDRDKGGTMDHEHKTFSAKVIKADEKTGIVDTIFAVMGNIDHGNDMIHPGAFAKTFVEHGNQVLVLDQHNTGSIADALGHPKFFKEIDKDELPPELLLKHPNATGGAFASVQFNMKTEEGSGAFHRLDAGDIKQWSFAYDALDVDFSEAVKDGEPITIRNLRTLKLFEISPVLFGMNEATMTVAAKVKTENGRYILSIKEDLDDAMMADIEAKFNNWLESGQSGLVIGVDFEFMLLPDGIKVGRVLSARNAGRINSALHTIIEVLDDAGIELDGFTRTAADDEKTDEPELEPDIKQGAGPVEPPTLEVDRLQLLAQVEQII